jgi:nucleoside-diphosphate-sugar epimerase
MVVPMSRGHRIEPLDNYLQTRRAVRSALRDSGTSALDYGLSLLRLKRRADPFYQSMLSSISAFHGKHDIPWVNRPQGAHALVELCEEIGRKAEQGSRTAVPSRSNISTSPTKAADVALIGGTGFIGRAIAKHLVADGASVAIVARRIGDQSALSRMPGVRCIEADISRPTDLGDLLEGVRTVVNAATPTISDEWPETLAATLEQVEALTYACLNRSPRELIHLGSTAALYLGSASARITGTTPPDPRASRRSLYSRAKAAADVMLLQRNHDRGLPVCILRPGIVIGEGGTPYHSGVGLFVNEQHCIGWNTGRNPLPFVLVDDVASAVAAACQRRQLEGQCYNIVGDVRLTAREYVSELAEALGRPIRFHPQSVQGLYLAELGKWGVKRVSGRRVPLPSYRDLKSRGFSAFLDCEDTKREFDWKPLADRDAFIQHGIRVHASTNMRIE